MGYRSVHFHPMPIPIYPPSNVSHAKPGGLGGTDFHFLAAVFQSQSAADMLGGKADDKRSEHAWAFHCAVGISAAGCNGGEPTLCEA